MTGRYNIDHLTFLLQLLELELLDRETRATLRRLKAARFPTTKTLDTLEFAARLVRAARESEGLLVSLLRQNFAYVQRKGGEGLVALCCQCREIYGYTWLAQVEVCRLVEQDGAIKEGRLWILHQWNLHSLSIVR